MKTLPSEAAACGCEQCLEGRKLKEIADKLTSAEDREWLLSLYNAFFEARAELQMTQAYNDERKYELPPL